MNLLQETLEVLKDNNLTWDDIESVQGDDFAIPLETFKKLADTKYDNGYGSPKVAEDLKIIGNGWWIERAEYDGSEWWEFRQCPKINNFVRGDITALTINQANRGLIGWENLSVLNEPIKVIDDDSD